MGGPGPQNTTYWRWKRLQGLKGKCMEESARVEQPDLGGDGA
jgi:hypothetical protein